MLRHSVNILDKNLKFYFWLFNMMIHDSPARLEKIQQKAFLGTPYWGGGIMCPPGFENPYSISTGQCPSLLTDMKIVTLGSSGIVLTSFRFLMSACHFRAQTRIEAVSQIEAKSDMEADTLIEAEAASLIEAVS